MLEGEIFKAANFDEADPYDLDVLKQLKSQYWDVAVFPITNDRPTWSALDENTKTLIMRVFAGLTNLDSLQGELGAPALLAESESDGEAAVWAFIVMTEIAIHAESYSRIFMTLDEQQKGKPAYIWSDANQFLQAKNRIVREYYANGSKAKKLAATVMLESFLFYSGFFLPLWLHGQGILTNTGDVIKTIIKDEAVHGSYAGAKYQAELDKMTEVEREEMEEWLMDLMQELFLNEIKYTESLYADFEELVPEVKLFLKYNADRAMMNLGYDPVFQAGRPNEIVMKGLSLDQATHDFFSQKGSNYAMANVAESNDDTWNSELVLR
jgi:ribonucleoside-diphosphate reductase beta chain